jgi:NAD dependent epimerase/dehydratase family enzyme
VLITGGSGLIGRNLARTLLEAGHHPVIFSCRADAIRRDPPMWAYQVVPGDPTSPGRWRDEVDRCDSVLNLAGRNVLAERWSTAVKAKIPDSRVYAAQRVGKPQRGPGADSRYRSCVPVHESRVTSVHNRVKP